MNNIYNNIHRYTKYLILTLIFGYIIYKLYIPLIKVLFPFLLSLVFTYLLNPIVVFFEKKKLSKVLSIVITYMIIIVILLMFLSILFPIINTNIKEIIVKAPSIIEKYKIIINELAIRFELSDMPLSFKQVINHSVQNILNIMNNFATDTLNIVQALISNIIYILLIPIITFYYLKDGDYLKQRLVLILPYKLRDEAIVTWYQIDLVLKRFIRGELIVATIVGISSTIALYLLGVRFPLILGFIAGITNFIPYIGPLIGLIPAVLVAFVDSPLLALKTIGVYLFIQQFESGIIAPKVVGECVGLHPITIIFSILLAERLFGLIGMFFALPITLIIIIVSDKLFNKIIEFKWNKTE